MRTAASMSFAFISTIFCLAISSSWEIVTRPTEAPLPGVVLPAVMPAAFLMN